jgi:hypothetical protein
MDSYWPRRLTYLATLSLIASAATLGAQSPARSAGAKLAGVAYTIRVGGPPRMGNGLIASLAPPPAHYVAEAVYADGRGRMDIVAGGVESVFAAGDYVLFDSTDLAIVHPSTHEFVPLTHDATDGKMGEMQAMGLTLSIGDVKVTIDSIPGTDTIAGHATRHFRMTTAFTMSVAAGLLQQRLATDATTDYWVADVPGMPGNPLLQANGFAGTPVSTGMFKELSARVDSAAALMGPTVALKTSTSSRLMQGPGAIVQMQQTSEVSDLRAVAVDQTLLMLPEGYKETPLPGMSMSGKPDAGAKWRVAPGATPRAPRH